MKTTLIAVLAATLHLFVATAPAHAQAFTETDFFIDGSHHPLGDSLRAVMMMPTGASAEAPVPACLVVHGSGGLFRENAVGDNCGPDLENKYRDLGELLAGQGVAALLPSSFMTRDANFDALDPAPSQRFCEDNDDSYFQFVGPPLHNAGDGTPTRDSFYKIRRVVVRALDLLAATNYLCSLDEVNCNRVCMVGTSNGGTSMMSYVANDLERHLVEYTDITQRRAHESSSNPGTPNERQTALANMPAMPVDLADQLAGRALPRFTQAISPGCSLRKLVPTEDAATEPHLTDLYYPAGDVELHLDIGTTDSVPDACWNGGIREEQAIEYEGRTTTTPSRYLIETYLGEGHDLLGDVGPQIHAKLTALVQEHLFPDGDLSVAVEVPPAAVLAGAMTGFTVTLSNTGPDDADRPVFSVVVPAGVTDLTLVEPVQVLAGDPAAATDWSCALVNTSPTLRTYECLKGDTGGFPVLPAGTILQFGFSLTMPDAAVDVSAHDLSLVTDPDPSNNSDSATIDFDDRALTVAVSGPASVAAGVESSYTVTLGNSGSSSVQTLSLSGSFNGTGSFNVTAPTGWGCTGTTSGFDCDNGSGSLGGGVSVAFTVSATPATFDESSWTFTANAVADTPALSVDDSSTASRANAAPIAVDDALTVTEGATGTGTVLSNDTDADGDTLTASVLTAPANGSLTLNGDGSFSYTHDGSQTTTDAFTYTVSDGNGGTDTGSVAITVTPENDAPVAVDDTLTVAEGATGTGNVLGNDTDADGDTLTASVLTAPTNGSLTLNADGSFSYTHDGSQTTTDAFSYTVSDGNGGTDTGTVAITVTPENDAPVAVDDALTVAEGATATGNVLDNDTDADGDTLTASVLTAPSNGSLTLNGDGSFSYTHDGSQTTTDAFSYTVSDGNGGTDTGAVNITIHTGNAPSAADDAASTDEDSAVVTGNVLANDSDLDGDSLSVLAVDTSGTLGLVSDNGDGTFTYDPNGQFESLGAGDSAADTYDYTISDGNGGTASATVTVTINGVNDLPFAATDSITGVAGTIFSGDVSGNDWDIEGDALTFSADSQPAHGSVSMTTDGSFSYTPDGGFTGADSFTYGVSDGLGTSMGIVSLTVTNNPPVAGDDMFAVQENGALSSDVSANDRDGDAGLQGLTYSVSSEPTNGLLVLNANGTFVYTPDADFSGIDGFTYEVSDGVATVSGQVTITVVAAGEPGLIVNGERYLTDYEEPVTANVSDNDTDLDGATLTYSLVTPPAVGSLSLNADGAFDYQPPAGSENHVVTFIYEVDNGTDTAQGTAEIRVGIVLFRDGLEGQ